MDSLEVLLEEHEIIGKAIGVLSKGAKNAKENGRIEKEFFEEILEIIKNFADGCHHGKEETVLFPLIKKKSKKEAQVVKLFLEEHEKGRNFIKGIRESVEKNDIKGTEENSEGYSALLLLHIKKENLVFPRWINPLEEKTKKELWEKFEEIEERVIGKGKHEEYVLAIHAKKPHYHRKLKELEQLPEKWELSKHIIIVGAGVMGAGIASAMEFYHKVVIVDHDPEVVFEQLSKKRNTVYGNIENDEIWEKVNLRGAILLVITVPEIERSVLLVKKAKEINPHIVIFARAKRKKDALELYNSGADFVVLPDVIGSNVFIKNIASFLATGKTSDIQNFKDEFIQYLREETEKDEYHFRL